MTFPFESVYDQLARRAVAAGLPKDTEHPPMMFVVAVKGNQIDYIEDLPVEQFFGSPNAKAMLGQLLQKTVPLLPMNACLVLISEAYQRRVEKAPNESSAEMRAKLPDSLADDPLAEEVLLFNIYRPGQMRMGSLPINPDRSLTYRPLTEEHTWSEGRLAPETTPPASRTTH